MDATEEMIWEMCNPHIDSETGSGPTYLKFRIFVQNFLAPYMDMKFTTEKYYEELWNEIWSNKNTVHQLPRGHSKTELIGIWVTIWIAVFQPNNPFYEKYKGKTKPMTQQTLIAGAQADLDAWTDRIKDFFDKVPRLRRFKPEGAKKDAVTIAWNKREMKLNNGHQLHLRTVKSRIRGLHVDRVVADDLITEASSLTDKQTIDVWDGAVHGTTTSKEAMINVIGTPLRYTDIQYHLKNKPEGYFFKARPAIINHDEKTVLSPNRRSYDDLMRVKREIGSTKFSAEYMLNPIDDSVSLIKREHIVQCLDTYFEGMWLQPHIRKTGSIVDVKLDKLNSFTFRREDWQGIFITADFAFSNRATADWTVFSYYGVKDKRLFKLGYIRAQGWSAATQMAVGKALHEYFKATTHGYEENSIKGIVPDIGHLNLPVKLFWMGANDSAQKRTPGPEFRGRRRTIGKVTSIERLDVAYENKKLILPYKTDRDKENMDLQIEESISWALEEQKLVEIGRHPDIPITDILANELLHDSGSKVDFAIISPRGEETYDDDEKRTIVRGQAIVGEEPQ